VAIGIIFGATRIIFKYSLTSAYVFQIPLRHRIWRKRFPLPNVRTSRRRGAETGFILGSKLMFLNIEFYFSFYRNSALLHGIS
jgi:hypothetical protein